MRAVIFGSIICIIFLSNFLIALGIANSLNTLAQTEEMSNNITKKSGNGYECGPKNPIEKLISSTTEWLEIFSLDILAGFFIYKTNENESTINQFHKPRTRRKLIKVIAVLPHICRYY